MPLYSGNKVQDVFAVVDSASSITVGFDTSLGYSAATAGNTILVMVACGKAINTPAGFTADRVLGGGAGTVGTLAFFRIPVAAGGETTWTVSTTGGTSSAWMWRAVEVIGLAVPPVSPVSQQYGQTENGTVFVGGFSPTYITGETGSITRLDVMGMGGAFYVGPASASAVAAWPDFTFAGINPGDWSFIAQYRTANGSGDNLMGLMLENFTENDPALTGKSFALFGPDGTGAATTNDSYVSGFVQYASIDSATLDPIVMGTGFEFGTHNGITGGPTAAPGPAQIADAVAGTHGTGYQVTTTNPKNGTYHLRITAAATAPFVRWTTNTLGTGLGQAVFGGYVCAVSATTNPAVCWEFAPAAGTVAQIVYNVSTTKFGVRWGSGGTVSYQAGTTAVGAYAWIDLLAVFNATTWTLTWRIEESGNVPTTQASPANLTGQTASTWASATAGTATSQTCTFDHDDICLSNALADYPLGRHKVVLLIPDVTVAASLNGTAGSTMSAITANATGSSLTTVGAANIPALLDEVPPNFSATADGICAATASTTDNVEIAMTTYTATSTERIDAVRLYMAGWAVSSTAAAFGFRGVNVTETVLVTGATTHTTFGSTTTGSATVPGWYCKNLGDVNGWTQTKLNALSVRLGFSSDATPDIGAIAVYAEVAVLTDYTPATDHNPVGPLQRSPRPVEQGSAAGPYAPSSPSTIIGG